MTNLKTAMLECHSKAWQRFRRANVPKHRPSHMGMFSQHFPFPSLNLSCCYLSLSCEWASLSRAWEFLSAAWALSKSAWVYMRRPILDPRGSF
jgi:hypothetical protein